ncbi:MAG: hypothetical protein LBD04_10665 [Synergistaceae bacterium]|nr:hypothetical protein [Synergistaceae bacterium]
MKKFFAAALLVLVVLTGSIAAEAGTITIKNSTGIDLYEIYVSGSGTGDWEEDVMGQEILENGQTLRLTVNGSYSKFDMRAVDGNGTAVDWFEIPGNAKSLTIYADGTVEY